MTAPRARLRQETVIPWLLAAVSGLLYVVAFPGFDQFYLAFVAFVPVAWAARDATPLRAARLGLGMGVVSHLIAFFWINHLLITFAFVPAPFAAVGWVGFSVMQGASYGVGLGLARWLQLRTGWPWALSLAVGLVAMDLLFPEIFPSYVANTMAGATWMMQTADLFGVLGITGLVGAINGALLDVILAVRAKRPLPLRTATVTAALAVGAVLYGAVRTPQIDAEAAKAEKLRVGLVQTNIGGIERLEDLASSAATHQEMTRALADQHVDLVVWPEGAYGDVIHPDTDVRRQVLGGLSQPLLFGAVRTAVDPATRRRLPYNSAFLADGDGRVLGYYDKIRLLVFGEYIPLGDTFPKLYEWVENASHWGRGKTTKPLILGGWRFGTYICYEDIIPRLVWTIMQPSDGLRPNLMMNITNDSWYGPYKEQEQHLALATFRAVEHRRALVRSTNTGISALIDPNGRVVARTPKFVQTTLVGEVPKMEGSTVYEQIGDVVGYAAVALLGVGYVLGRRRRAS